MKQFSNKLMLCAASNIPDSVVFPYSEFKELHSIIEIAPKTAMKDSNAGSLLEFSLKTTHETISETVVSLISNKRPLILLLFDDSGNHYQVGSKLLPVISFNNGVAFNGEILFTAQLLQFPF